MKVVILCGGQGTRIRDVADDIPKPMIKIGGFPILWHIMKYFAQWGHKEFILCLGYKGYVIKEFFLNYEANINDFTISLGNKKTIEYHNEHDETDWKVTLVETGANALTGTRVKRIQRYLNPDENFMLTYGDGLCDVDLDSLLQFHNSHGKIMTVTGVKLPGRFGELKYDENNLLEEFNEKPQARKGRISGGFFVCRPGLFDYIDEKEDVMLENEPMRAMVQAKQLMVFKHDGSWQCMDNYHDYQLLTRLWERDNAFWKKW